MRAALLLLLALALGGCEAINWGITGVQIVGPNLPEGPALASPTRCEVERSAGRPCDPAPSPRPR